MQAGGGWLDLIEESHVVNSEIAPRVEMHVELKLPVPRIRTAVLESYVGTGKVGTRRRVVGRVRGSSLART